ncbi:MAG: ATP-binding cassette domain-containing protein [Devosia sp.]
MALLEVSDLSVALDGVKRLDNLRFTLEAGERLGIFGENGAGKSLLLQAVAGLLPREAMVTGAVSIDGAPIPANESERAKLRGKRIGIIVQHGGLDPMLTIGELIVAALVRAGKVEDAEKRVVPVLADVGLEADLALLYPADLTPGQQRLVDITIALAGEPELLIADDPGNGLDLFELRRAADLIARHCASRKMSLLVTSHDLKLISALSTKVMVLKAGAIAELVEKTLLFTYPRNEHTRKLVTAGRLRPKTLMRAPIGPPLLEVANLSKQYSIEGTLPFVPAASVPALDNVSLVLRTGESVALMGAAGAGKSTLARTVAGLDLARSGEIKFDTATYHGADLPRMFRRDISFVFADPLESFDPSRPVGDSVAEPLRLEPQRLAEEISERIVEILGAVGVPHDLLSRYPRDLTRGQLQRLAIARALITKPRLIVLDDPTGTLDVLARGETLLLLNRLRDDFGMTFLIVTQDFEVAQAVSDRVMVMDRGRIVETGAPAYLVDSPRDDVTKRLVAARLPDIATAQANPI